MRIFVAPYSMRVSAARHIARELGGSRILPEGSRYRYRDGDLIINWGRSEFYDAPDDSTLNPSWAVKRAVNKIKSFTAFSDYGVPTVDWTCHADVAEGWWREGDDVIVRHTITGRGGHDIQIVTQDDAIGDVEHSTLACFPDAPLYTRYFKRKHEYRVHVVQQRVVDFSRKKRRRGVTADFRVRSFDNGWVFCREGVDLPGCVQDAALQAVDALALDFGAVDVGHNVALDRAAVFEVNSAPGIEGTTLERYINAFKKVAQ